MRQAAVWAALVLFALSGCIDSDASETDAAGPAGGTGAGPAGGDGPDASTVPEEDTFSWEGGFTAVGATTSTTGPSMAGSFSLPDSFFVRSNSTSLHIEMVPDGGVSSDMMLRVWSPGEAFDVGALPDALPTDPIVFTMENPEAGEWEAMGFVEGAAVEQTYTINVLVRR